MLIQNKKPGRLLALSGLVALLSACGGDGSEPERVEFGELGDPDRLPLGTFNFPVDKLNYDFDELFVVSYWNAIPAEGDVAVELFFDRVGQDNPNNRDDQGALMVDPTWMTADDRFTVETSFATEVITNDALARTEADLTCADAQFSVYMPQEYVDDGNMTVMFFIRDVDGNLATFNINSVADMTGADWNEISLTDITPDVVGALNPPSFDTVETGFDLSRVQDIGVQFDANGKTADILASEFLRLDNFRIVEPAIRDCVPNENIEIIDIVGFNFDDAAQLEQWNEHFVNGSVTYEVTHDATAGNPDGAMRFGSFNWVNSGADGIGYRHMPAVPVDLTGKTYTANVFIPSAYVEDQKFGIQLYVTDSEFRFASFEFVNVGNLRGDQWNTIEVSNIVLPTSEARGPSFLGSVTDGFDGTNVNTLGIQFVANGKPNDINGDILVDNVRLIEFRETNINRAFLDDFADIMQLDNWSLDFGGGTLTAENTSVSVDMTQGEGGAMAIDLSWGSGDDQFLWRRDAESPIDLTGAVVRMDVWMPQNYVDNGNLRVQVFTKDESNIYGNYYSNNANDFDGDAWNSIEVPIQGVESILFSDPGYNINAVQAVGIQLDANSKPVEITGTIFVDNVEVILPNNG